MSRPDLEDLIRKRQDELRGPEKRVGLALPIILAIVAVLGSIAVVLVMFFIAVAAA